MKCFDWSFDSENHLKYTSDLHSSTRSFEVAIRDAKREYNGADVDKYIHMKKKYAVSFSEKYSAKRKRQIILKE